MNIKELNNQQRRAVEAGNGPVVIIAGPGTGKTKTLTARIAYLLTTLKVPAHQITALSFTNKAAREMRERVTDLLGSDTSLPRITTFHGLGYEILSSQSTKPLQFATDEQRLEIIRDLPKSTGLKGLSMRELAAHISRNKNTPNSSTSDDIGILTGRYNETLAQKGLHDFDDLLSQTHTLLSKDQILRKEIAASCTYLLVDEFQDTNQLQYELLKLLKNSHVFVIGDPLQSIYGFRGASGDIFGQFQKNLPDHRTITLTTNYRSAPEIVQLCNAIFPDTPQLTAHQKIPGNVQAMQVLNEYSEAAWVLDQIEQHLGGTDMLKGHAVDAKRQQARQFSDYAVLYRTHRTAKTIEQKMAESGIPYQVVGDDSPHEKPPIKTIIQVLRTLGGDDQVTIPGLSKTQLEALTNAIEISAPLSQIVQEVINALGLMQETTGGIVHQFTSTLVRFNDKPLKSYLSHLDQIAEQGFYDPQAEAVTLLTIHASKGLEFTHVFLIGAEEGLLPFQSKTKATDLGEEQRLFYVAATRAREQLDILYTKSRAGQHTKTSQFITSLPDDVLPKLIDPNMADQQKRLQKRHLKHSQQTLF